MKANPSSFISTILSQEISAISLFRDFKARIFRHTLIPRFCEMFLHRRMVFSFLGYLFFILKLFTFLYYANEESDAVRCGSTKTVQPSIKNNKMPPMVPLP